LIIFSFAGLVSTFLRIQLLLLGHILVLNGGLLVPALLTFEFVFTGLICAVIRLYFSLFTANAGDKGLHEIVQSGGQRQRFAIARALIRKAKVLVDILKSCTVILVTHRLAIAISVGQV
jgi:ABC-type bacteriocin/lantibiotic exporter with double-glycine peptidase domain